MENSLDGGAIPFTYLLPRQPSSLDWVLDKVKEIQDFVELSCEGFEDQFIVLLTIIEVSHTQSTKSITKKQRDLKRLVWSLNYEGWTLFVFRKLS